jgi:hypothetical protein
MSSANGWTASDPTSPLVWVHHPSGVQCHLQLTTRAGDPLVPTSWEAEDDLLPDAAGESHARMRVWVDGGAVAIECAGHGAVAACQIVEVTGSDIVPQWAVAAPPDGWQVRKEFHAVAVAPADAPLPSDIPAFVATRRAEALAALPHGSGLLEAPLQAAEAALAVNTVLLPDTGERVVLSRHTAVLRGEWRLPNWQTFLSAVGVAYLDPELALDTCRTALARLAHAEILGTEASPAGVDWSISHPPVAAYCLWKVAKLTGEMGLIHEAFPQLLRWHGWWQAYRRGHRPHFLAWASPEESGMPTHPLYAEARADPRAGLLRLDDVGLCSLWTLDAYALMRMALWIGLHDSATQLELEIRELSSRLNLELWDPRGGRYASQDWTGVPTTRQSATALLPLIGRLVARDFLPRLISAHLAVEFNTPYLVPTVGSEDPAFGEQLPWRGRTSALLNYLICEGLRQFGVDDWAERITLSGLACLRRSWGAHQLFESYNALTGDGDDHPQDPLAPSGILWTALGVGMLIDWEAWYGLRVGNLLGAEMGLSGVRLGGRCYDVATGAFGLTAARDGAPWLAVDRPAIVRNLVEAEGEVSLHLQVAQGGPVGLRLHGYPAGHAVSCKINGVAHPAHADAQGVIALRLTVPATGHWGGEARHAA